MSNESAGPNKGISDDRERKPPAKNVEAPKLPENLPPELDDVVAKLKEGKNTINDCMLSLYRKETALYRESTSSNHSASNKTEMLASDLKVEQTKRPTTIYDLPPEILIIIFSKLSRNELGVIALVCKNWLHCSRCPTLWEKVDMKFRANHQHKIFSLIKSAPFSSITHMKFDCMSHVCSENFNFSEFCNILGHSCPLIKVLVLHFFHFSINLQSVVDLCSIYVQHLDVLSLHDCFFKNSISQGNQISNLKILDLYYNNFDISSEVLLAKIPSLTNCILVDTGVTDLWFQGDPPFLQNLQILNLNWAVIGSITFQNVVHNCVKLTELYLCGNDFNDNDFISTNICLPNLKIICISNCLFITCDGIVAFLRSCPSLGTMLLDERVFYSCARHQFFVMHRYKLQILQINETCSHYEDVNYLHVK